MAEIPVAVGRPHYSHKKSVRIINLAKFQIHICETRLTSLNKSSIQALTISDHAELLTKYLWQTRARAMPIAHAFKMAFFPGFTSLARPCGYVVKCNVCDFFNFTSHVYIWKVKWVVLCVMLLVPFSSYIPIIFSMFLCLLCCFFLTKKYIYYDDISLWRYIHT